MASAAVAHSAGIDVTYLSGIERAKFNPSLLVLAGLADALSCDFRDLLAHWGVTIQGCGSWPVHALLRSGCCLQSLHNAAAWGDDLDESGPRTPMEKRYVDVAVVVPLPEEFEACLTFFEIIEDISSDEQIRLLARAPGSETSILLAEQRDMGKASTRKACNMIVREFDVGLMVCAGIAAGLSKDVNIGDVCYTGTCLDISENTKVSRKRGKDVFSFSPVPFKTPDAIAVRLRLNRITPDEKPDYERWQQSRYDNSVLLIPGEFNGKDDKREQVERPSAREGVLACGIVSASPGYNDAVRLTERRVLGLETESAALFEAAQSNGIPAVAIRGISDYAGSDKTRFEQETNNQARVIAATNAMSFLALQLSSARLKEYCASRRGQNSAGQSELPLMPGTGVEGLESTLDTLRSDIDSHLRELAVGYELLQKGYRLPVPRISISDQKTGVIGSRLSDPIEVRDALRENRVITISVPPDYPDHSLSWIIASDLLTTEIGGRQIIPVVVKASDIQRPRKGLQEVIPASLLTYERSVFARLVVIIDEFRFEKATVTDFLADEISKREDISVIIVSRSDSNLVIESRFASRTGASEARLQEISFVELSRFVSSNFEMNAQASEVIALRLDQAFRRFRMPTHPAYFAGISRDVLAAILGANRRVDLIELAVTGYLTYAVSGDTDKIILSRRAREVFLTQLAVDMRLNEKRFTEAELVQRAEELATRKDFDIRPASFVAWFSQQGILHYENGYAIATLPFVEAFLLARKLASEPDLAKSYFDISRHQFDHATFAIYCELGISDDIIQEIVCSLDSSIQSLEKPDASWLSSGKIKSSLLARQSRVDRIQKNLESAMKDIRNDKDVSQEKQKLIDAAGHVRGTAEERRALLPHSDHFSVEERAISIWNIAATLLGSGAETLDADVKRALIGRLIRLTSLIIEDWSRLVTAVDFESLRQDLLKDERLLSSLAHSNAKSDLKDAERLVDGLVDVVEFTLLIEPFQQMSNRLCSEAHDVVLAQSISKVSVNTPLEELVRALWLADLDASRGKSALEASIKALKNSRLLRVGLTHHLVWRVFWDIPDRPDRMILLELADESMRIIGRSLQTDQLDKLAEEAGRSRGGQAP